MSIIHVLIPIACFLLYWPGRYFSGLCAARQFDDLDKEGLSILFDEKKQAGEQKPTKSDPAKQSAAMSPGTCA